MPLYKKGIIKFKENKRFSQNLNGYEVGINYNFSKGRKKKENYLAFPTH